MIKTLSKKIGLFSFGKVIFLALLISLCSSRFGKASIPNLNYQPEQLQIVEKHKFQPTPLPLFPRKTYFSDFDGDGSFNDSLRGMSNMTSYSVTPSTRFGVFFKNKVRLGVNVNF